jgi:nicotinamide riboside kinase
MQARPYDSRAKLGQCPAQRWKVLDAQLDLSLLHHFTLNWLADGDRVLRCRFPPSPTSATIPDERNSLRPGT